MAALIFRSSAKATSSQSGWLSMKAFGALLIGCPSTGLRFSRLTLRRELAAQSLVPRSVFCGGLAPTSRSGPCRRRRGPRRPLAVGPGPRLRLVRSLELLNPLFEFGGTLTLLVGGLFSGLSAVSFTSDHRLDGWRRLVLAARLGLTRLFFTGVGALAFGLWVRDRCSLRSPTSLVGFGSVSSTGFAVSSGSRVGMSSDGMSDVVAQSLERGRCRVGRSRQPLDSPLVR